ncbi:MAG: HAD family hydrolase [Coriobacteriia bacterium]|nr:HAD family hydrolase [Coriobacteriia bacterium]
MDQNAEATEPVRLAVFDFDGTSLDGSSTVHLVLDLLAKRKISVLTGLKTGIWGVAYKLHLPQNESWVRSKVWQAFEGRPADEANRWLSDYYDRVCEPIWRPAAEQAMLDHKAQGHTVVIVSASFEPIVKRCVQRHPVDYQVSTRMCVRPNGTYGNSVEGAPIEGPQKLTALRAFADATFGPGNWVIEAAYGDHYSDKTLLEASAHPHAVTPGPTLRKHAQEQGWPILSW